MISVIWVASLSILLLTATVRSESVNVAEYYEKRKECIQIVQKMLSEKETIDADQMIALIRSTCPLGMPARILVDAAISDSECNEKKDEMYISLINSATADQLAQDFESSDIVENFSAVMQKHAQGMIVLQKKLHEKRLRNIENK